jgi:hypothetical protein
VEDYTDGQRSIEREYQSLKIHPLSSNKRWALANAQYYRSA